jgi:hypothetical protein
MNELPRQKQVEIKASDIMSFSRKKSIYLRAKTLSSRAK